MILREAVGVAEGVGVSVTLQKVPRWCASQTQGPGLAGHVPWAPQEQHVVAGPTPSQQTSLQNAHSPAGLRGHRHSNGRAAAVLAAHRDVLGALRPGLPVQAGGGGRPPPAYQFFRHRRRRKKNFDQRKRWRFWGGKAGLGSPSMHPPSN